MRFENIYKETDENMRLALLSLWAPGNHPMRPAIEDLFNREPLLAEPVFHSTFGWKPTEESINLALARNTCPINIRLKAGKPWQKGKA